MKVIFATVGAISFVGVGGLLWWIRQENVSIVPAQVSVVLTTDGFEPQEVSIQRGGTVVFTSTAERPFWPASNLHPSHEIYSEFDPLRPLQPDESWSFTFNRAGDWGFHDHVRSYYTGTIHVVDE